LIKRPGGREKEQTQWINKKTGENENHFPLLIAL
jgi:hypothetical protein